MTTSEVNNKQKKNINGKSPLYRHSNSFSLLFSPILAVNEELKIQITNQQSKLETERRRLDEQEEKVKRYKEELERAVAEIRSLNEPSQDKHQDQLSRSGSSEKKLLEQQVAVKVLFLPRCTAGVCVCCSIVLYCIVLYFI